MAIPEQQQQLLLQKLMERPGFAQATPDFQQAMVNAFSESKDGIDLFHHIAALQKQYPQYIKNESIWKNKAFLIGLGALTAGAASAAIPAIMGAGTAGGAGAAGVAGTGVGIGETGAVSGLAGSGFAGSAGGLGAATVGAGGAAVPVSTAGGILGTLGKWAGPIGDIGQVASGVAGGLASGRRADSDATARAIAENNRAKVEAAQYNLKLPEVRTNQTARGEVLNTMQNAPLTGDSRIDKFSGGGLRPSAFGPNSRAAGAEMSRQALAHLMDPSTDRLTPQEIPGTHPSTPENIAAGVGIGADLFSLLAKYGGRNGAR